MKEVAADASTIADEAWVRENLARAHANMEGTYIVRMFAAFEATLRSYDRHIFNDPKRETASSVMIDQLGSKSRLRVRSANSRRRSSGAEDPQLLGSRYGRGPETNADRSRPGIASKLFRSVSQQLGMTVPTKRL